MNWMISFWKNLDLRQIRQHALSIIAALVAFGLVAYLIWSRANPDGEIWRLISILMTGVSFFLVPGLIYGGVEIESRRKRRIATAVMVLIYGLYAFVSRGWTDTYFAYKTFQGFVLCHLFVSLSVYFRNGRVQAEVGEKQFWSENWFFLNRFNMAATQSTLLLIGVCLGILSVEHLFGLSVKTEIYETIAAFDVMVVSVFLFIGSLGDQNISLEPPELLKRIVRTVLTPLALIYLGILYAYTLKLVISRDWPHGEIGFLVSGLAFIITLSYAIMRPLSTSDEFGPKIKLFWRYSFRLLIVPVIVLMMALSRRVSEYGWTEQRASLGFLALWMLGIGVYYWNPTRRSLVGIPLSLSAVLLITWFGPLSPDAIGERSQTNRLKLILAVDRPSLSTEQKKEANSILHYLCNSHGPSALERATGVILYEDQKSERAGLSSYLGNSYHDTCGGTGPHSSGAVAITLKKLGLEPVDLTPSGIALMTIPVFQRQHPNAIAFEHHDFAQFHFDNDINTIKKRSKIGEWVTKTEGRIQLRLQAAVDPDAVGFLEWSVEPDIWHPVKIGPLLRRITESKSDKLNNSVSDVDHESADLRITETDGTTIIEFQLQSIFFNQADRKQMTALHVSALATRPQQRNSP